ncbi:MAG: PilZ domain-containing protein [Sphingomicrobium sp.]
MTDEAADARADARTNLFMAATLHAAEAATPVKIRDLSAGGAQVETSLQPDVGSAITLARGRLQVHGHVPWCTERRCGIHFSSNISVQDWMANPVNREQRRVDCAVAVVKSGAVPIAAVARPEARPADPIANDLRRVARLLDFLGDALANDPALVTRHGTQLQNLDIAIQTLTALAEAVGRDPPHGPATMARLAELRTSCAEALHASS